MNILVSKAEKIVLYATNKLIELDANEARVFSGNVKETVMPGINTSNTELFQNLTTVPTNVEFRFKYENDEFIKNDQYFPNATEELRQLSEMTILELPKTSTPEYIEEKVNKIVEFWIGMIQSGQMVTQIPDSIKAGLFLLGFPGLTGQEAADQKAAQDWVNKIRARVRIDAEVGDVFDQIANVDKQVQLITPVILRTYQLLINLFGQVAKTIPIELLPAALKLQYDNFSGYYLQEVGTGAYKDRIDIDPNPESIINRVLLNNTKTGAIVKEEYLDKK